MTCSKTTPELSPERLILELMSETEGPSSLEGVTVTVNRTSPEKSTLCSVTLKVLNDPASITNESWSALMLKPVTVSIVVAVCVSPPEVAVTVTV